MEEFLNLGDNICYINEYDVFFSKLYSELDTPSDDDCITDFLEFAYIFITGVFYGGRPNSGLTKICYGIIEAIRDGLNNKQAILNWCLRIEYLEQILSMHGIPYLGPLTQLNKAVQNIRKKKVSNPQQYLDSIRSGFSEPSSRLSRRLAHEFQSKQAILLIGHSYIAESAISRATYINNRELPLYHYCPNIDGDPNDCGNCILASRCNKLTRISSLDIEETIKSVDRVFCGVCAFSKDETSYLIWVSYPAREILELCKKHNKPFFPIGGDHKITTNIAPSIPSDIVHCINSNHFPFKTDFLFSN